MTHTPEQIRISHLIDDAEKIRGKALRAAKEIDRIVPDLQHAIQHGRTTAAVSLLALLDRYNRNILAATGTPVAAPADD